MNIFRIMIHILIVVTLATTVIGISKVVEVIHILPDVPAGILTTCEDKDGDVFADSVCYTKEPTYSNSLNDYRYSLMDDGVSLIMVSIILGIIFISIFWALAERSDEATFDEDD